MIITNFPQKSFELLAFLNSCPRVKGMWSRRKDYASVTQTCLICLQTQLHRLFIPGLRAARVTVRTLLSSIWTNDRCQPRLNTTIWCSLILVYTLKNRSHFRRILSGGSGRRSGNLNLRRGGEGSGRHMMCLHLMRMSSSIWRMMFPSFSMRGVSPLSMGPGYLQYLALKASWNSSFKFPPY